MSKVPRHTHKEFEYLRESILGLDRRVKALQELSIKTILTIYSADQDICIGRANNLWHRIVCQYEGNKCIGGPRPHWESTWSFDEKGFHLESFLDHNWKGWHGQYREENELKYDELDRKLLQLHHDKILQFLQKEVGIYYPCHLYDDINCVMYRP